MTLQISGISKTYSNGVKALSNINLEIPNGMFGLLGPNGAGKSTLMRTIATLQEPDEGEILFNSTNVSKRKDDIRKTLGYLPQEFGVYPKVTATELLNHLAILKGITDKSERKTTVNTLLELTNLTKHKDKKLGGYSGGMKQRFGIAQALIGNPKLIIVDEPTAGLDPEERVRFHNILSEIGENITVILSTHIVNDVSELCHQMAIIDSGNLLIQTTPQKAISSLEGKTWSRTIQKNDLKKFKDEYKVLSTHLVMGKTLIHIYSETNPENEFKLTTPDLEDYYFAVINGFIKG